MAIGIRHGAYILSGDPDIAILTEFEADKASVFIRGAQLVQHAVDLVAGAWFAALGCLVVADETLGTAIGFVTGATDDAGVTGHAGSGFAVAPRLAGISLSAWTANSTINAWFAAAFRIAKQTFIAR